MNGLPAPGGDPLALLRDIHIPADPGWWPLAPGWWLCLALLCAALGFAAWLWGRRRARLGYRRAALKELSALYDRYRMDELPAQTRRRHYLLKANQLLKRAALASRPRRDVAGLSGKQWLVFLDGVVGEPAFTRGPGRSLGAEVHSRDPQADVNYLQLALKRCLRRM